MLLTVLMLAAFPAFRGLERSANRHRAVAEADAIAQAALAYRRTYGQWPLEASAGGIDADETAIVAARDGQATPRHLDLAAVAAVLRNAQTDTDHNPRRILFLELPEDRIDTDGTPLDPWGQPYVLVMSRLGENNSVATVARHEGGNRTSVRRSQASAPTVVEGPEDAVAFSWGDPASKADEPSLFSWSKR